MLEIVRFDASGCGFPVPCVPVRAAPALRDVVLNVPTATDANHPQDRVFWHFRRGRYALHRAYSLAGVGQGRPLLMPAYHCRTMLDPAIALGADLLLYPLKADLQPDLPAIDRLVDQARQGGQAPSALLVPHYFGFAQPLSALAALCHARGIELIEDCSHALVLDTGRGASPALAGNLGRTARIGVSSPYKFLPSGDGGLMWASAALVGQATAPAPAPWSLEWRGLVDLAREWARSNRGPADSPGRPGGSDAAPPADSVAPSTGPSADYLPVEQGRASLAATRWLMRHTRLDTLALRRQQRFRQWLSAVTGLGGCRPLITELPEATVPYMFPLLLDNAWPTFHRLKHLGLPIWRWDQMAVSDCAVAQAYRTRLIHLPCHQGLTDAQMDWMTSTVRRVLGHGAPSTERRP